MSGSVRATILCFFLVLGLSACAADQIQYRNHSGPDADLVTAWLSKPEGDGPFPAVILLHGCAGLGRDVGGASFPSLRSYQSLLTDAGFVTLIVDSYGSRGFSTQELYKISCTPFPPPERAVDLTGAIRFLKSLPYVNKAKIGAFGQSQGGRTVVEASGWRVSSLRKQVLSAGVALYPGCVTPPYDVMIPLLILIGDADRITPASYCQRWLERYETEIGTRLDETGKPIGIMPELIVYPGVYHSYDLPIKGYVSSPLGTEKPDREARVDTRERMIAFFKKHLGE